MTDKVLRGYMKIFYAFLELLSGMGVFLIAVKMLTSNLESLAGPKIKDKLAKLSKSKLVGVGIGTAATALIQSSGAVTVMAISFVNSGVMSLTQATAIIYGANIGTTITAQIVAVGLLGSEAIAVDLIFGAFAGIGAFVLLFAKKESVKKIGGFTAGFGMIFIGLSIMTASMNGLAQSPQLVDFLAALKNPMLLLLAGILLTAILQSSSAMTGLTITMVFGGLLTLEQGIYLTLGSNIGTCVVAFIATIGSITNARRVALIHLLFNVIGVVLFVAIDFFLHLGGNSFARMLQVLFPNTPATQLAMMHTIFNIASVVIMLPFIDLLVRLTEKLMPAKESVGNNEQLEKLATILITTNNKQSADMPSLENVQALSKSNPTGILEQIKDEIIYMAELAMLNYNRSNDAKTNFDFSSKKDFEKDEGLLEFMKREATKRLFSLSNQGTASQEIVKIAYLAIAELQCVSNQSKNNFGYTKQSNKRSTNPEKVCFSHTKGEI